MKKKSDNQKSTGNAEPKKGFLSSSVRLSGLTHPLSDYKRFFVRLAFPVVLWNVLFVLVRDFARMVSPSEDAPRKDLRTVNPEDPHLLSRAIFSSLVFVIASLSFFAFAWLRESTTTPVRIVLTLASLAFCLQGCAILLFLPLQQKKSGGRTHGR